MPTILELREERATVINRAREIVDLAEEEERDLTDEEQANYDAALDQADDMRGTIESRERLEAAERELAQPVTVATRPDLETGRSALQNIEFVSRGLRALNDESPEWREDELWRALFPFASDEYRAGFRAWAQRGVMSPELRALQADSDIAGGYLYAPMQFVDRLIQAVDNMVYIRQWATVYPVPNAESLGAPSLDNDPADPTWTSELAIGSEDSTMTFGRRELEPHPLAKYIKVSRKLLRKAPSAEALVRARLAYKFGVTAENAYQNGDGVGQPLGVFTASDMGISTSRDVSTGNTTTSIKFDGLIEAKYTLKTQYWPRAKWLFHRDGVKQIAKLKDGEGQYIWRESVRVGEPDRILGIPTFMSEYSPSTFTTGLYVGVLGDFSYYWIADSLQMELQRLDELYAATNQVGFIGRLESDGMPVLEEAFVRVKLA